MTEAREIAENIGLKFESLEDARSYVREVMGDATEQVIDNVAWELWV